VHPVQSAGEYPVKTVAKHRLIPGLITVACLTAAACSTTAEQSPPPDRAGAIPANAVKVTAEDDLHPPVLHSGDWEDPVPLGAPVNTAGAEDSPFVTPDGTALYFFFTPDVSIPAEEQLVDGVTGIWVSHWNADAWGKPERVVLSDPGEDALDGCEFVSGNEMWFCTARQGNFRAIDIYTAVLTDGKWSEWENAGEQWNVDYLVGEMHLSADGTELYYHSIRDGGLGDIDIWVSRLVDGTWQEPENVTGVNTEGPDGWPFLSQDGSELWLTRLHEGTPAIFRSTRQGDEWGPPELILSQFAGEASLDASGNLYFTHHFYDGDMLEADIYFAEKK
jgi:hypothetical protein